MQEIARGCGVSAMPTFQFFRNGTRCDELRGADKNGLEEKIKKHYVEVELPEDEQPKARESETTADANGATGELRQRKQQPKIVKVTSDEQWKELLDQNRASGNAVRTATLMRFYFMCILHQKVRRTLSHAVRCWTMTTELTCAVNLWASWITLLNADDRGLLGDVVPAVRGHLARV